MVDPQAASSGTFFSTNSIPTSDLIWIRDRYHLIQLLFFDMDTLRSFSFVSRIFHVVISVVYFSQLLVNPVSQARSDLTEGSSYFFYQHPEYPRDCQEIQSQCSATKTVTSEVHLIKPAGYPQPFEVSCDNINESGGWTVIQRRFDGSIDFGRSWEEYKDGFGFPSSEFWLGTEKLSYLTNQKTYELQIDIVNAAGIPFSLHYDQFRIGDEWGGFKSASFGTYSGNATNATTYCPANMEYDNCFCQATCSGVCQKNCVDGEEACICPNGFFLDQDSNCVLEQECSCYDEDFGVIPDGAFKVSSDCSRNCSCKNYQLSCVNSQCSADATCLEIGGTYECQCNEGFERDGQRCIRPTTVPPTPIRDCFDLYNAGTRADGVYTINPSGVSEFQVYCDMTTDGGGWTVFQRREDGSENFYRNWAAYKVGFGPLGGEHWLGNDKLHTMTNTKNYQLRVDIVSSASSSYHSLYDGFRVEAESNKYRLRYSSHSGGTAGDSLYYSRNERFSTYDQDNDQSSSYNCAEKHRSGWWHYDDYCCYYYYYCYSYSYCYYWRAGSYYYYCTDANLNGDYSGGNGQNIFWYDLPRNECNIPQTEMKIRPI